MSRTQLRRVALFFSLATLVILGGALPIRHTQAQTAGVAITQYSFQPGTLVIPMGATVAWANSDPVAHTATSDTGVWNSGPLGQNAIYIRTFTVAGTYPYHCSIHLYMHGSIVVQAPTTPTAAPTLGPPPPPPPPPTRQATPTPTLAPPTRTPTVTPTPPVKQAPDKLQIQVTGKLTLRHRGTISVHVLEAQHHHAVPGAKVSLDGRAVGILKILTGTTGKHGIATFTLLPAARGVIVITARKKGYKKATKRIFIT